MSYFSPDDVAEQLGVTAKTVREWLKSSEIVGVKLGGSWKIHQKDLSRFVDGQRLQALVARAKKVYPDTEWHGGTCESCGEITPVPGKGSRWVCSAKCKEIYDRKWGKIVGEETQEHIFNEGKVIPPF